MSYTEIGTSMGALYQTVPPQSKRRIIFVTIGVHSEYEIWTIEWNMEKYETLIILRRIRYRQHLMKKIIIEK